MNAITRRIAAATTLIAAPALIALGAATGAHADTSISNKGPTVSAPAPSGGQLSQGGKTTTWQPRTHHQRRHHAQHRHDFAG